MKRRLSCICLVLVLGSLACSPAPQPYWQKREMWSPAKDENVQLQALALDYLQKRILLRPAELDYITAETCSSGWVRGGKKMIGVIIIDRRLIPENIDKRGDFSPAERARIALVLVNARIERWSRSRFTSRD